MRKSLYREQTRREHIAKCTIDDILSRPRYKLVVLVVRVFSFICGVVKEVVIDI